MCKKNTVQREHCAVPPTHRGAVLQSLEFFQSSASLVCCEGSVHRQQFALKEVQRPQKRI